MDLIRVGNGIFRGEIFVTKNHRLPRDGRGDEDPRPEVSEEPRGRRCPRVEIADDAPPAARFVPTWIG